MSLDDIDRFVRLFEQECAQQNLPQNADFAHYFISLLACDLHDNKDMHSLDICKQSRALQLLINRYKDPLDARMCNLKLAYYYEKLKPLKFEIIKEQHEKVYRQEMQKLIALVLHYPETSNVQQIDEMCTKMTVFIISWYEYGCPDNLVLRNATRICLNSVIGKGDLKEYVLKRKIHRLEYLQRLSATVCGIMIYNHAGSQGKHDGMRNILQDLELAQSNTEECFDLALKRVAELKKLGFSAVEQMLEFNITKKTINLRWPMEKAQHINAFIALFAVQERALRHLRATYDKTKFLIDSDVKRLDCVNIKIQDILKYRLAVDSELVFPHFVYLSELWSNLTLYYKHIVEIAKTKEKMDEYVSEELQAKYIKCINYAKKVLTKGEYITKQVQFEELTERANNKAIAKDFLKIKQESEDYCALTISLTCGLLLPATLQKKLCENLKIRFGFKNIELAKYAELHFEDFLNNYINAIYTSVDLMLLFNVEHVVLANIAARRETLRIGKCVEQKQKDFGTQTEMVVVNDLSPANRINVTWNIWDYHRETRRLAQLRLSQTRSTQSLLTFGKLNAQTQAYNARRHL